jgi:hypothetical protein
MVEAILAYGFYLGNAVYGNGFYDYDDLSLRLYETQAHL